MVATTAPSIEILVAVENSMRLAENGSDTFAKLPEMVAHVMSLLTMKQREKGSHRQDLKEMSLKAWYFLKSNQSNNAGGSQILHALVRNVLVVVNRKKGQKEELHYRLLSVFRLFNKKWFLTKPDADMIQYERGKALPKIRMDLRLLKQKLVGSRVE